MRRIVALMMFWLIGTWGVIAQTGTWKAYMSYYEPQQIVKGEQYLFVRASNGLYSYNLNDHSITTYDKTTGLTDVTVSLIGWNTQAHRLIVVYDNQQIDLLSTSGTIVNISALANKSLTQDKTVNRIDQQGEYAYLSCNFGIVKVNMQRAEVSESYMLAQPVTATAFAGGNIYARKSDGTALTARLTDNLLDASVWKAATTVPAGLFDENSTDWDTWLETVKTLQPGGPKYNESLFLKYKQERLICCTGTESGAFGNGKKSHIQLFVNNEWISCQDELDSITGHNYVDLATTDFDPTDPQHIFAGGRTGLYEFRNGQFIKEYNYDNSELKTTAAIDHNSKNYTMVQGMTYDGNGNLWLINSGSPTGSLFEINSNGEWISHHHKEFLLSNQSRTYDNVVGLYFDSKGLLWMVNDRFIEPCLLCYDPWNDAVNCYTNIVNQDGTTTGAINSFSSVAEDKNGDIWIGTNIGPFLFEQSQWYEINPYFTQIKIPRNDGSNYADYLLNGIKILSIAVDGGNRKWFGTEDNGVYLISADNMTQIYHFTKDNSQLLSNKVTSIAIDSEKGEVFFATDKGICSYMNDANEPSKEMTKNSVWAFPNPITPDYTGLITITGLSYDSDVKIVTSSGKLVNSGRSNGGMYTWNGLDLKGHQVSSGIYMVIAATNEGKKGTVCKIAIIR